MPVVTLWPFDSTMRGRPTFSEISFIFVGSLPSLFVLVLSISKAQNATSEDDCPIAGTDVNDAARRSLVIENFPPGLDVMVLIPAGDLDQLTGRPSQ